MPRWSKIEGGLLKLGLQEVATDSETLVIVAVPQLEGWLFTSRDSLPEALRDQVTDADLAAAYYEPRKVLEKHLGSGRLPLFFSRLTEDDLARLRAVPEVERLRTFLSEG